MFMPIDWVLVGAVVGVGLLIAAIVGDNDVNPIINVNAWQGVQDEYTEGERIEFTVTGDAWSGTAAPATFSYTCFLHGISFETDTKTLPKNHKTGITIICQTIAVQPSSGVDPFLSFQWNFKGTTDRPFWKGDIPYTAGDNYSKFITIKSP